MGARQGGVDGVQAGVDGADAQQRLRRDGLQEIGGYARDRPSAEVPAEQGKCRVNAYSETRTIV